MEPNQAYNAVQLNNLTANEAIYDSCEPPEEPRIRAASMKQANTSNAADTKRNILIALISILCILAFALALAGLVLFSTNSAAQTDTLNKILTAVQNTSNRLDEALTTPSEESTPTTPLEESTSTAPSDICGGPGWRRFVFINMTDPNHDCPQGLNETSYSKRSCGRAHSGVHSCSSVTFPVISAPYSRVCGRVTAYRWGYNFAFLGYHAWTYDINGSYGDGLSLTHGSPRTHIWTFVSGRFNGTSGDSNAHNRCPCDEGNPNGSPPFVGDDYFCESVATVDNYNVNPVRFFPDNALWDGDGCHGHNNTCCLLNNPPWFKKILPAPTSDDIELRMCINNSPATSNIGIELVELYAS